MSTQFCNPPSGGLVVDITLADDCARVAISGEIDLATVSTFAQTLTTAATIGRRVEVDLSDVTFMDSQGVSTLARHAMHRGNMVVVTDASAQVRRLLELTGMTEVLAQPSNS